MGGPRVVARNGESLACNRGLSVCFELPVLDSRSDAGYARWQAWAVLPCGAWDGHENARGQVAQNPVGVGASLDCCRVLGVQCPVVKLPACIFEKTKRLEFRQRLGDPHRHVRQQGQESHYASCQLTIDRASAASFLFDAEVRARRFLERCGTGGVLCHRPEQKLVLFGCHPPSPKQGCNVFGRVETMDKRGMQKFGVFWVRSEVACLGDDATPPPLG